MVPNHVREEVHYRHQRLKLRKLFRSGALKEVEITDLTEIDLYAQYRKRFGEGESACLALAASRGWSVASDEKAVKRELAARPAAKYLNSESLMEEARDEGPIL
jgi:predicted nucleic acid-binding protein